MDKYCMVGPSKAERLVAAAGALFHERGYSSVTIADVAKRADVPLGNVYYYFKTQEALLEAVVEQRLRDYDVLEEGWNQEPDPRKRIKAFVQMAYDGRAMLARSGCPLGSLCIELTKETPRLGALVAARLSHWLRWLEKQFRALGHPRAAEDYALEVLSAIQGSAVLAHGLQSTRPVIRQSKRLMAWIDSI